MWCPVCCVSVLSAVYIWGKVRKLSVGALHNNSHAGCDDSIMCSHSWKSFFVLKHSGVEFMRRVNYSALILSFLHLLLNEYICNQLSCIPATLLSSVFLCCDPLDGTKFCDDSCDAHRSYLKKEVYIKLFSSIVHVCHMELHLVQ